MKRAAAYFSSSIGKKQIMGLTGLGLCGFVLTHMIGNLLYLKGPDAYNGYSLALTSNHLIYVAEGGLIAMFVLHVLFAIWVSAENRAARPIGYAKAPKKKGAADLSSKTMLLSGLVVLAFVVLHLITFKFGPEYPYTIHGEEGRDLHKLMTEVFLQPLYTAWYVLAISILGLHLSHALWSSLQTLGLVGLGKEKKVRLLSYAFGVVIVVGFLVNPIYIYVKG